MKKSKVVTCGCFFFIVLLFTNPLIAFGDASAKEYFIYFYVTPCDMCSSAAEVLDQIETYKDSLLLRLNLYEDNNLALYYILAGNNSISDANRQVPVLFFEGGYTTNFSMESVMEIFSGFKGIDIEKIRAGGENAVTMYGIRDYLLLFGVGLLNGLNPCSISMILLLSSLLIANKKNTLKYGLAYIVGKLLTYLAIGILFYKMIALIESRLIRTINLGLTYFLIITSLILAFFHFLDFLAAKREQYGKIRIQLPRLLREFSHKMIKNTFSGNHENVFILVIFSLSVVISLTEFICTGQIYLAAIVYLNKSADVMDKVAVAALLIYTLAMLIPHLAIIIFIALGKRIFDLSETFRKNMPLVKLAGMLIFLCLALFLILFSL